MCHHRTERQILQGTLLGTQSHHVSLGQYADQLLVFHYKHAARSRLLVEVVELTIRRSSGVAERSHAAHLGDRIHHRRIRRNHQRVPDDRSRELYWGESRSTSEHGFISGSGNYL